MLVQVAIALGVSSTSYAASCDIEGVWSGLIGDVPITLELKKFESLQDTGNENEPTIVGRYYYRHYLEDLFLKNDTQKDQWTERNNKGEITGYITKFDCQDGKLTAQWISVEGRKTNHLQANTKIKDYQAPRLSKLSFTAKPKNIGNHQYSSLLAQKIPSVENVESSQSSTIQLPGSSPGIKEINKNLKNGLIEAISTHLDCSGLGYMNYYPSNTWVNVSKDSVVDWNNEFVVIENGYWGYCGGAHGYGGKGAHIYNLATGELEQIKSWFDIKYQQLEYNKIDEETPLGRKIYDQYIQQNQKWVKTQQDTEQLSECLSDIEFNISQGNTWITSKGFVFQASTPYALRVCGDDVVLPFEQMISFLSPTGKSAIQAFQK